MAMGMQTVSGHDFYGTSPQALAGLFGGAAPQASAQTPYTPQQVYSNTQGIQATNYANTQRMISQLLSGLTGGVNKIASQYPKAVSAAQAQQLQALRQQQLGNQQMLQQYSALDQRNQAALQGVLPWMQDQITRTYTNQFGQAAQNLLSGGLFNSSAGNYYGRGIAYDANLAYEKAKSDVAQMQAQYGTQIGLARLGAAAQGLYANTNQRNLIANTGLQGTLAGLGYQGQALGQLGSLGISGLGTLAQLGSQVPQYNPGMYGSMPGQPQGSGPVMSAGAGAGIGGVPFSPSAAQYAPYPGGSTNPFQTNAGTQGNYGTSNQGAAQAATQGAAAAPSGNFGYGPNIYNGPNYSPGAQDWAQASNPTAEELSGYYGGNFEGA